jgi:hypothetical protein
LTEKEGWGTSGSVTLADGRVAYAKRVPLTDTEVARPRSTKNHFRLPSYYSYGVGSAGCGAWRELAVHEAVSGLDAFPALLEWRVQARAPRSQIVSIDDTPGEGAMAFTLDEYVTYWHRSRAVEAYMRARATATSEVWLALEHCGVMGFQWLLGNQGEVDRFLAEVLDAVAVLRSMDVVHFDSHLANVVVSDRARLTDFGLSMSAAMDLSADERRFFDRHRHYDVGVVFASLGQMLLGAVGSTDPADFDRAVAERSVPYADDLWAVYERHRAPIRYMLEHIARMMRPSKRSRYDDVELAALLKSSGVRLD